MITEYSEDVEEAAQIARTALPLAGKYALSMNPINYAVLYEYVLGKNSELKKSLDTLFNGDEPINRDQMYHQYKTHLQSTDEEAINNIRQTLLDLMSSTQHSLSQIGDDSQSYSNNLNSAVAELQQGGDISAASDVIAKLIEDTTHMQSSSQSLQDELTKTNDDLAKLRTEFKRVRQESMIDPLTGIQNRRSFDDELAKCCATSKSNQEPLSLLIIDIDHFKKVNDTYGHVVGDAVLKRVAEALNNTVRGGDLLARYGGEEFVVVLPNTPMEGAERVADNICNNVRNLPMDKNQVGKEVGRVTVSVGVALYHGAESEQDFVARSDTALYRAKESGRNRVCTHTVT